MSGRPWKQQRLDSGLDSASARIQKILNIGTAADANVRKILASLDGQEPSWKTVCATRHAKFDSLKHTIRVPLQDGGEFDWHVCHPGLLVSRLVGESEALKAVFKDAMLRHPCAADRPWGLVVGFDEHIPGNKLALNPGRKSMNLSFSFEELGGSVCEASCCDCGEITTQVFFEVGVWRVGWE